MLLARIPSAALHLDLSNVCTYSASLNSTLARRPHEASAGPFSMFKETHTHKLHSRILHEAPQEKCNADTKPAWWMGESSSHLKVGA